MTNSPAPNAFLSHVGIPYSLPMRADCAMRTPRTITRHPASAQKMEYEGRRADAVVLSEIAASSK